MAEILLFHRTEDCIRRGVAAHHYLDEYTDEERATWNAKRLHKYNVRNRVGDVVQIEEDGFWTVQRAGWGYPVFYLLCLPFVTKAQAVKYLGPWYDAGGVMQRKCRYGVDALLTLPFVNGKLVITTKQDARDLLKDASTGGYVTF